MQLITVQAPYVELILFMGLLETDEKSLITLHFEQTKLATVSW